MNLIAKILKSKKNTISQFYESLEDLPLYNWSKMHEKNDLNWLRIDYDGRQKQIKENETLLGIKKRLHDEYFLIWNDDKFKETLQKRDEINYYVGLYNIVKSNLDRLWAGYDNSQMESRLVTIRQLKKLHYVMPELNSFEGDRIELERLYQQNEGVKTKIKMLSDSLEVDNQKETRRLNTQLADISKTLELGYPINAKEITVADWIDLQKQAIDLARKRKVSEENKG